MRPFPRSSREGGPFSSPCATPGVAPSGSPTSSCSLDTGEKRVILQGGSYAKYVPTGHLLYARPGSVLAAPFDLDRLEVTGPSVPVLEGVSGNNFAVSRSGTLAYVSGEPPSNLRRLVWVDRTGGADPLPIEPGRIGPARIAPRGRFLAFPMDDDVWVHDLERGTTSRLTQESSNYYLLWTPDGERIVFTSLREGTPTLWCKRVDGSEDARPLAPSEDAQIAGSFSPDGRLLAFHAIHPETGGDLSILPLEGDEAPIDFLATPAWEGAPQFSPDGRWLAYVSDETGRFEIYVRPYPGPGRKWQISRDGGRSPLWPPDGSELFYRSGDAMMAVDVTTEPSFDAGAPRVVFRGEYWNAAFGDVLDYDVSSDGEHFLMVQEEETSEPVRIHVVLNWFEELKRLVPTEK